MQKTKNNFNKLLWFYLFLNPFLDIISGAYIYFKFHEELDVFDVSVGLTPSLFIRMAMLVVFAVYIIYIRDKKSILLSIPMAVAFVMSIVSEYLTLNEVNLLTDAQYFAKYFYNIAVLLVYANYFASCGYSKKELYDRVHSMLCIVTFILCAGIIIPYIFDFGFFTYADRFGYRGFRGVFYSGNDVTATLMLITPITFCRFLSLCEKQPKRSTFIFYGLEPVLSTLCLLVIGTKTAYLAVVIAFACTLIFAIVRKRSNKADNTLKYILYTVIGVLLCMGILSLLARKSVFTTIAASFIGFGDAAEESTKTLVLSGRQNILKTTFNQYLSGGFVSWLFGIGRGSVEKVVEMDVFEVLFYYGIFGAVSMLWLYVKHGVAFVVQFFKNLKALSFEAVGAFIALGTCVFYLVIAGHVLFSVTSGFYFSIILLYSGYFCFDTAALPAESSEQPKIED